MFEKWRHREFISPKLHLVTDRASFHSLLSHFCTYSCHRDLVVIHFVPVYIHVDFGNEHLSVKRFI